MIFLKQEVGGGSARRAMIVVMRPECMIMAGYIGMVMMSVVVMTVCAPLYT